VRIGSAYEAPEHAELVLEGAAKPPAELAQEVLAALDRRGVI
jgi:adenylylsulfate kinase-like enzyme